MKNIVCRLTIQALSRSLSGQAIWQTLRILKNIWIANGSVYTVNYSSFESVIDFLCRYIIQTWVPQTDSLPRHLLSKGYKLIMSTKDAWYFDHGFWGQTRYYTWKMAYKNRIPRDRNVLGGEACVWSELIDRNSIGKCFSSCLINMLSVSNTHV